MIEASIIADSLYNGNRLTTFVLKFPRIILSEFNTHRVISKNSASSRAIPFTKMVDSVTTNKFNPIGYQKNHSGMQGTEYFDGEELSRVEELWGTARDNAIKSAKDLYSMGVTKQLCNRILEPFAMHTVIATATEWENFFALRAHPDAEIHIADLAEKMLKKYNENKPNELEAGQWHIPFGDNIDMERLRTMGMTGSLLANSKIKISTARCARVSYMDFHGKDDYESDMKLHDRLISSGHWSPFEHCAQATNDNRFIGNLKGFIQYRKFFKEENKKDSRVVKR